MRASRFLAQRLDRGRDSTDLVELVRHLLAVQAQDPAAFPLAVRARAPGTTAEDLAKAREARTIVRCWGPRGTLHLIAADDLAWLLPLVQPGPAGSVRRLRQLGVRADADEVTGAAETALRGQGPLTKARLGDRLASAGLPVTGQAIVHAAFLAARRGLVVLGPEQRGKPTYVHAADWLGAPLPAGLPDRDAVMRTLVTRYRAAHEPCTAADLAAWSGLPSGEVQRVWTPGPAVAAAPAGRPSVRLVPAFDESRRLPWLGGPPQRGSAYFWQIRVLAGISSRPFLPARTRGTLLGSVVYAHVSRHFISAYARLTRRMPSRHARHAAPLGGHLADFTKAG